MYNFNCVLIYFIIDGLVIGRSVIGKWKYEVKWCYNLQRKFGYGGGKCLCCCCQGWLQVLVVREVVRGFYGMMDECDFCFSWMGFCGWVL